MARLATCGWESQDTNALAEGGTKTGTVTIDTTNERAGGGALACAAIAAATSYNQFTTAVANGTSYYARTYVRIPSNPTGIVHLLTALTAANVVVGRVVLNTDGTVQFQNSAGTNVGSASPALTTGAYARIEVRMLLAASPTTSNGTFELRVDGVSIATASNVNLGTTAIGLTRVGQNNSVSPGMTFQVDDFAVNDSSGSAQNSWPGPGWVMMLLPVGDWAVGTNWLAGAGATTNLYDAVNNEPPVGVAAATNTSQIKNAAKDTAGVYDSQFYAPFPGGAGGVPAGATVALVQPVGVIAPNAASAITAGIQTTQNPVISEVTKATPATAAGTHPTGWVQIAGGISYSPTIPNDYTVVRVRKGTSSTTSIYFDFIGLTVEVTPTPPNFDLRLGAYTAVTESFAGTLSNWFDALDGGASGNPSASAPNATRFSTSGGQMVASSSTRGWMHNRTRAPGPDFDAQIKAVSWGSSVNGAWDFCLWDPVSNKRLNIGPIGSSNFSDRFAIVEYGDYSTISGSSIATQVWNGGATVSDRSNCVAKLSKRGAVITMSIYDSAGTTLLATASYTLTGATATTWAGAAPYVGVDNFGNSYGASPDNADDFSISAPDRGAVSGDSNLDFIFYPLIQPTGGAATLGGSMALNPFPVTITPSTPHAVSGASTSMRLVRGTYAAAVVALSDLVGYWRLGEASGTTAFDDGPRGTNTVLPSVSNANISSNTTIGQTALPLGSAGDTAMRFNGEGFLAMNNAAALAVGDNFSFGTWITRERTGAERIATQNGGGGGGFVIRFDDTDHLVLEKGGSTPLGTGTVIAASTTTITDTNPHFIVVTKNGTDVHIYIDGVDVTGTVTNQTIAPTATGLWVAM